MSVYAIFVVGGSRCDHIVRIKASVFSRYSKPVFVIVVQLYLTWLLKLAIVSAYTSLLFVHIVCVCVFQRI